MTYLFAVFPLLPYFLLLGVQQFERALTFHPLPFTASQFWQEPAGAENISIVTPDNVFLRGWLVKSSVKPAIATVLYFHGNSGNIGNLGWLAEDLADRGFDTLLFDYRGYGMSEGKIRDEHDLFTDADAAYDYAVGKLGVSPDRLVLYGQSLGTAAVVDLASRRECAAIVLESGLVSAEAMGKARTPLFYRLFGWLGKNRLDSRQKLSAVHCPVLITHGEPDSIVPTSQGLALFAAASSPKKLILVPGADHNVCGFAGKKYFDQLGDFMRGAIDHAFQPVLQTAQASPAP